MKPKQIWTLLIILVIFGAGTFFRQAQKPAELSVEEFTPLDLSFEEASISKIVFERNWEEHDGVKPEQKTELVKTGAAWKLPGFFNAPVNEAKVKEFFRQVREAKGEERARGQQFFKDFGISDNESFKVSLFSENQTAGPEFYLGLKTAGESSFIRKAGSDVIYLTGTNFFAQMGIYGDPAKENLTPEPWAAVDFLKVDSAKVRGIEIKAFEKNRESVKASLELSGADWKIKPSGASADNQKVRDFLDGMANWRADKVADAASYDFTKPFWQMTVSFDGGTAKTFTAAGREKETEAVYFGVSGETAAYLLSNGFFENLDKDSSYFEPSPAPSPKS